MTVRILITRPAPDAARSAAALRARGHDAIVTPFLSIEHHPQAELGAGPWSAILVTSANAAAAMCSGYRAVNPQTILRFLTERPGGLFGALAIGVD